MCAWIAADYDAAFLGAYRPGCLAGLRPLPPPGQASGWTPLARDGGTWLDVPPCAPLSCEPRLARQERISARPDTFWTSCCRFQQRRSRDEFTRCSGVRRHLPRSACVVGADRSLIARQIGRSHSKASGRSSRLLTLASAPAVSLRSRHCEGLKSRKHASSEGVAWARLSLQIRRYEPARTNERERMCPRSRTRLVPNRVSIGPASIRR